MTTELEKQFFDTFGIEKKTNNVYGVQLDYHIEEYPQITDRILLELMCIYARKHLSFTTYSENASDLKHSILSIFIENAQEFKQQVQALFKE